MTRRQRYGMRMPSIEDSTFHADHGLIPEDKCPHGVYKVHGARYCTLCSTGLARGVVPKKSFLILFQMEKGKKLPDLFPIDQEAVNGSEAHSPGNAGERPGTSGLAGNVPASRPLDSMERSIVETIQFASFPPATAAKRFVRHLSGHLDTVFLSDRGRCFLASIANRFRRQYALSVEQWAWIKKNIPSDWKTGR